MKKTFAILVLAASIMWSSCGENKNETVSTDSTMNNTSEMSSDNGATTSEPNIAVNKSFNTTGSYFDLKTNKPVKFKVDSSSQYLMNYETDEPFDYYFYNPASRDTFDRFGNVVNNFLLKDAKGIYTIDEKRWKVKRDSDGDMKMKDEDGNKIKYDASSDKVKIKTEDTTIKQ